MGQGFSFGVRALEPAGRRSSSELFCQKKTRADLFHSPGFCFKTLNSELSCLLILVVLQAFLQLPDRFIGCLQRLDAMSSKIMRGVFHMFLGAA